MTVKNKEIAIVEAALKLFKEKGFSAVRIADIAREAGVGKGTVYEYFSSKEELLQKACSLSCDKTGERIDAVLNQEQDLKHPVKIVYRTLQIVLTQLLSFSNEENKLFYELSVLAATNPGVKEMVSKDFQSKIKQWQAMVLVDYQRGLDSGHFRKIEPAQDSLNLWSPPSMAFSGRCSGTPRKIYTLRPCAWSIFTVNY